MMNLQHLNVKIMIAGPKGLEFEAFIPVFHGWIQKKITEEMLIDVADYLQVPEGPGVMLIGHQANMSMDHTEGRWGFLYNQKTVLEGSSPEKIRKVIKATLGHALRLQEEPLLKGQLSFRGENLQFNINDRLLAPNTEESFKALEPDLKAVLGQLYAGSSFTLQRHPDPRERLTLDVKADKGFELSELIKNIGD